LKKDKGGRARRQKERERESGRERERSNLAENESFLFSLMATPFKGYSILKHCVFYKDGDEPSGFLSQISFM